MSDRYSQIVNLPIAKTVAGNVGLPVPTPLERFSPGQPLISGSVLLGSASGGRLLGRVESSLHDAEVETARESRPQTRHKGLVFAGAGIGSSAGLGALRDFFSPGIRALQANGRMLVLGTQPERCATPRAATAQRALEGFVRSLAKEAR